MKFFASNMLAAFGVSLFLSAHSVAAEPSNACAADSAHGESVAHTISGTGLKGNGYIHSIALHVTCLNMQCNITHDSVFTYRFLVGASVNDTNQVVGCMYVHVSNIDTPYIKTIYAIKHLSGNR